MIMDHKKPIEEILGHGEGLQKGPCLSAATPVLLSVMLAVKKRLRQ